MTSYRLTRLLAATAALGALSALGAGALGAGAASAAAPAAVRQGGSPLVTETFTGATADPGFVAVGGGA